MLIVFTGNGKGKTTASLGQAVRTVGRGRNVLMIQFIKGPWKSGEDFIEIKNREKGFTLIELLIVVGVLAFLATIIVLLLNPGELLAQSRDGRRLNDIATLSRAVQLTKTYGGAIDTSQPNVVYTSLPDTNADGLCSEYTLTGLATGWSYKCLASGSNLRKVNGTGWVPINFSAVASNKSPLAVLPVDPVNDISNFYTFTNGGGLTTKITSQKYIQLAQKDGGNDIVSYETQPALWALIYWSQSNNPSAGTDYAQAVVSDSTGIYVTGSQWISGFTVEWRIEKRNPTDGSLLWSQTTNLGGTGYGNHPYAITADSTGVYIAGYQHIGPTSPEWRIEKRSITDGFLIWSQTTDQTSGFDSIKAIKTDNTGIYLAGYGNPNPVTFDYDWRIEKRSLTNGSVIWAQTENQSGGDSLGDSANALAIDATGIYVAGSDAIPGNAEWRIEKRSLSDGSVIWTQVENPSGSYDGIAAMTIDSNWIYLAGSQSGAGWRLEKRNLTDGSLTGGWSQTSHAPDGTANAITVDSTGVYVAGSQASPGWRIEKHNLGDGSFTGGWGQSNGVDGTVNGMTIDVTGVYITGADLLTGNSEWRLEKRKLSDGTQ